MPVYLGAGPPWNQEVSTENHINTGRHSPVLEVSWEPHGTDRAMFPSFHSLIALCTQQERVCRIME